MPPRRTNPRPHGSTTIASANERPVHHMLYDQEHAVDGCDGNARMALAHTAT